MSRQRRSMAPIPSAVPHFKPINWQPINWQRTLPDYGTDPEAQCSPARDEHSLTMPHGFLRHRMDLEEERRSKRMAPEPSSQRGTTSPAVSPVQGFHTPAPIFNNIHMTDVSPPPPGPNSRPAPVFSNMCMGYVPRPPEPNTHPSSFFVYKPNPITTTHPRTPSPTYTINTDTTTTDTATTDTATTNWPRRLEKVYEICLAATERFITSYGTHPCPRYPPPRRRGTRFAPYPPRTPHPKRSPPPPYSRYPTSGSSALVANASAICGILWPRGALLTSTRARLMADVTYWAETVSRGLVDGIWKDRFDWGLFGVAMSEISVYSAFWWFCGPRCI
ncbi:hypothetical protein B0H67DRAFT_82731 [Lasiosphaeris hirsuta]|uniref:Uncharacterized protein n=1 Tax=Lasiosphaeris hirsuta TaxID=260670 RepID=A0AA40BCJ8_9PEZI|nr:hypothetical protein B0H67DRAFT_82731 [Lasiosphaeris hirsuta]